MKKKLFKYIYILLMAIVFLAPYSICLSQEPAIKKGWENALEKVVESTEYKKDIDKEKGLTIIIAEIISVFLSLLGVIFLILILYAGYLWMTAGGNEEQITKSKTMLRNSIIGLIIALSAYTVTYFILEKSIDVTQKKEENRSGSFIDW